MTPAAVRRLPRLLRQLRLLRSGADDGTTLLDVVISTTIMSFCMTIFTTGILDIYKFVNRTEAVSTAQSQLTIAFNRLDKEVRYAAGVSTEGLVGANPYVEYLTTNTGSTICTELRVDVAAAQLQRRTWTQGGGPVVPSAWIPLASGVTSAQPFTVYAADATFNFQRLEVKLTVTAGAGANSSSIQTDVTFTALNTSLSAANSAVCTQGRAIP